MKPLIVLTTLLFQLTLIGCSHDNAEYQLVQIPEENRALFKELHGTDVLRKVSLGNWSCYVPDKDPDSDFFCTHNEKIAFTAHIDQKTDVLIPITTDYINYVRLTDTDSDGNFESLNYQGIDKYGKANILSYDLNLDGIPDLKIDMKNVSTEVFHDKQWIKVTSNGKDEFGKVIYEVLINNIKYRVNPFRYPLELENP